MLLYVKDLQVFFSTREGVSPVINSVDFSLSEGDRLAVIGESGCGKTVLAMTIMGLLTENAAVRGGIVFNGLDLGFGPKNDLLLIKLLWPPGQKRTGRLVGIFYTALL